MNQIIKVNTDTMTVSARSLHSALNVQERFSAWIQRYLPNFIEGEDYTPVCLPTEVPNNGGVQIMDLRDYSCSVDMAKHICLMSRTEKGKQCRQYLIDLEKAWNTPERVMARALQIADEQIKMLTAKVEEQKPKAVFADAVAVSDTSILIRDLAKTLKQNGVSIGQNRLFDWMRSNGYICKGSTEPTQRAMEMGLFEVLTRVIDKGGDSLPMQKRTTKVTGKGQIYFINKFLGEKP